MSCEWLNSKGKNHLDEQEYSLNEIKQKFEVVELVPEQAWIALSWDEDKTWLKFCVLEFQSQIMGDSDVEVTILFHGDGPAGNLGECRHTYWGPRNGDGYIFYPKAIPIKAALDFLTKYYDMN